MKPDVSIVPCGDYQKEQIERALEELMRPFGGFDWVRPGMRIAVKLNLVGAFKPEQAATTHPALVCAICEQLTKRGASVVVGDSPGGLFTKAFLAPVYRACGLHAVEECGATLNDRFDEVQVENPEGVQLRSFRCTKYLLDADAIINVCKLKTHGLMAYTGACKNLFGAIPGMKKSECHYQFPQTDAFAEMLVDLYERMHPCINIADAVMAMEGNGPSMGSPRKIGALLAAPNAHALDLIGARLMGLSSADVPTLAAAVRRGLIPESAEQLNVAGDWESLVVPDFVCTPIRPVKNWGAGNAWMNDLLERMLADTPHVKNAECIGCGICARHCPAEAIELKRKLPVIHREKCIRCFCCQEFCKTGAMKVHRPLLAKILYR